jgi:hypothetical protein
VRCDTCRCAHRFEDWRDEISNAKTERTFRREIPLGLAAPGHTVPYGTVLSRDTVPGTSCQATIGCPSGTQILWMANPAKSPGYYRPSLRYEVKTAFQRPNGRKSPKDVAQIPILNPFVTFASFCSNPSSLLLSGDFLGTRLLRSAYVASDFAGLQRNPQPVVGKENDRLRQFVSSFPNDRLFVAV